VHLAGPIPWGLTLPDAALPATPVAGDLAQTEDVQITPAIQALADSLGKNPVKIYNWVRNNIEFLPTYGSIQGADMTLSTRRGNAFYTASLLIGLLRASNIPFKGPTTNR
jgi:transglutaminase-like putative cysteine protease